MLDADRRLPRALRRGTQRIASDAADRIFSILMGDDVEIRRGFVETNAIHVKDLDI